MSVLLIDNVNLGLEHCSIAAMLHPYLLTHTRVLKRPIPGRQVLSDGCNYVMTDSAKQVLCLLVHLSAQVNMVEKDQLAPLLAETVMY